MAMINIITMRQAWKSLLRSIQVEVFMNDDLMYIVLIEQERENDLLVMEFPEPLVLPMGTDDELVPLVAIGLPLGEPL